MTDQQMDARLRAAGERFRAENAGNEMSIDVDEIDFAGPVARRRFGRLLVVAAAVVAALVVGLAIGLRGTTHPAPPSVDNAGLVGNVWLVSPGLNAGAALYISPAGELVADDECRLIGAKATVTGNRLTVSDMTVRFKPCVDEHFGPGFYAKGARVLRGPATFRIDSAGMTITRAGVGRLRFVLAQTPIPPPSPDIPTLTGTDWLARNGTVLHIDPSTGQLSGGWCGDRAVVSGPSVRFTDCAATGRRTYVARITGTTLTLVDPHDRGVPDSLVFRWRPADPSITDPASLTGRTWHLRTVNGTPASSGSLRIDGNSNTAVVQDGCTTYRRTVDLSDGTFTIAGRAPAHACTDQASTADSFVFNSPATWTVRDGSLIVYGGASQTFALVYRSGRQTTAPQDPALLTGHTWRVTTITSGTGHFRDGAPSEDIGQLSFRAGHYAIANACSDLRGALTIAATNLTFGTADVDEHSCPPPIRAGYRDESAQAIYAVLRGSVHWSVREGLLTLSNEHGTLRAVGADPAELTGSRWTLTAVRHGAHSRGAIRPVVLSFPSAGQLEVQRCYTSGSKVAVGDSSIQIYRLHTTVAVPCPSGPAGTRQQNDRIDSVLDGEVIWSVSGDRLTLTNGSNALVFTRRR